MKLSFAPLDLTLTVPFTISRGTQTHANNIQVTLSDGEHTGQGEAAPSQRYGEFQATVLAFLERFRPSISSGHFPISVLHEMLNATAKLNPAAKAAVDMAAYDLLGQQLQTPVYSLLGLDPSRTPRTSYTIGIDTPEAMGRKAAEAAAYPVLKIKVGTPNDVANLEAIRAVRPDAVIRVDANEGWTPKEAIRSIEELQVFDLEFIEQPVPAADLEGLGLVRRRTTLPVIADESCVVPTDIPRVAPYVDGINIKIMKCGGLYPALQMIHLARAHQLRIMMGCMIESSLAITAAAHLSPLIDWADLDGHLLISLDPFVGVEVRDGKLLLPDRPGLGVIPRS